MLSEKVAINSQVLDENQSLFLNLSQHGLQIASDI